MLMVGNKEAWFVLQVLAANRSGRGAPSQATAPLLLKSQRAPPKINKKALGGEEGRIKCRTNHHLVMEVTVEGAPPPKTSWWKDDKVDLFHTSPPPGPFL